LDCTDIGPIGGLIIVVIVVVLVTAAQEVMSIDHG